MLSSHRFRAKEPPRVDNHVEVDPQRAQHPSHKKNQAATIHQILQLPRRQPGTKQEHQPAAILGVPLLGVTQKGDFNARCCFRIAARQDVVPVDQMTKKRIGLLPSSKTAAQFRDRYFPGKTVVALRRSENGHVGQCYQNVADKVLSAGGKMALGYALIIEPSMFIEALHHAAWERPDGKLTDITGPAYPSMKNQKVVAFVPTGYHDANAAEPIEPSVFHLLSSSVIVRQYVDAVTGRMLAKREIAAIPGVRYQRGSGYVGPPNLSQSSAVIEFQRLSKEIVRLEGLL